MNIFVDENIPAKTVKELRETGHDVKDILKIHQKVMQALRRFKSTEWAAMTVTIKDSVHSIWKVKR
ncbi:MAG TPA: hypothetical protein ENG83_08090 [Nitrospirae bacterium]|nr:hypothetical protein BMS3Abin06_00489 [bacterium BMS3Abin06]HDH12140.1 hypothetical protein [Nitrospirota bacterium]HDZ00121.1 hypothetical protein [Nitrospirota bacterium]